MFEYKIEDMGLLLNSLSLPPPDHYDRRESLESPGTSFRKVWRRDHQIVGFAAHDFRPLVNFGVPVDFDETLEILGFDPSKKNPYDSGNYFNWRQNRKRQGQ